MTETEEQKEIVELFRARWPHYAHCLRVSLAGINLGPGPKAARMVNYMHSMGVTDGEADLLLALPRHGYGSLVLEHKALESSHKASVGQQKYIGLHNATGNCAILTRGVEHAMQVITAYIEYPEFDRLDYVK
jgi:hypothetical protein